jgi:secreted Zn-dependent insulinase-like peptidase
MYNINYMSRNVRWHNQDKLNAITEDITISSLQSFAPVLLQRSFCESMVHGNISKNEAIALLERFEKSIGMKPLCSGQKVKHRCIQFPFNSSHVHRQRGFDLENPESAIQTSYQINPMVGDIQNKLKMEATLAVLAHLMQEPCYDQLRTKEQLGYMVWSGVSKTYDVESLWFVIQSTDRGPAYLDNRVESFIDMFYNEKLKNMDKETFDSNVQACILTRRKKDTSLYAQSGRFWKEIDATSYKFNRKFIIADVLKNVTHEDVLSLFKNYIQLNGKYRSKVSSHIVGKGHSENDDPLFAVQQQNGTVLVGNDIVSMDHFKSRCMMYPPVEADSSGISFSSSDTNESKKENNM